MSRLLLPSLVVAVALLATIGWEVQSASQYGADDTPGRPTPSSLAAAIPAPAPADPVDSWVTTSLERPLLRESRRPDAVAAGVAQKGDGILRLAGVVTGPFGDRAIFVLPGVAKPVIANVGAHVSDFVVRTIEPGRVVVDANGIARTYRPMYSGNNGKPVPISIRS
jgi:hypothetical protein